MTGKARCGTSYVSRKAAAGCEEYIPSNGHGLLQSGRIGPGDAVGVRIVYDEKKHTHRGHVTVLK